MFPSYLEVEKTGSQLFRAPTGCEPVYLTLNRCHNIFPCS